MGPRGRGYPAHQLDGPGYPVPNGPSAAQLRHRKEISSMNEPPILLGDLIRSRKPHPCGSDTWTVIRTGADIKMKCSGCGRIVMLDRDSFLRRRKALLNRNDSQ